MKRKGILVVVVAAVISLLAFVGASALPKYEGSLEGAWFIGSKIMEGGVGPENTHLYLWIEGTSAETLYSELDVPEQQDACMEAPSKRLGAINCFNLPQGFRCTFAIDIVEQRIDVGSSC